MSSERGLNDVFRKFLNQISENSENSVNPNM